VKTGSLEDEEEVSSDEGKPWNLKRGGKGIIAK